MASIISELEHERCTKKAKQATFEEASDIHLKLITKKTANKDREYSGKLMPFIGGMNLNNIGMRPKQVRDCDLHVLNQYILHRANSGVSVTTVNKELAFINLLGKKAVSDYGADVVKIEPPTGDLGRFKPPFLGDRQGVEGSGYFLFYNTNRFVLQELVILLGRCLTVKLKN